MPDAAPRIVDRADPAVIARLSEELSAFNFATTGIRDGRALFAAVEDADGAVRGAIYGWTWGGACWIEYLWVREDARRQGVGTALLLAAEGEARARGCGRMALTTHTFQAPAFYRRHGFAVVGEVDEYPAGHALLVLRKLLA